MAMATRGKTSLGDKIIPANLDCEFRCIIRPAARYSSAEVSFLVLSGCDTMEVPRMREDFSLLQMPLTFGAEPAKKKAGEESRAELQMAWNRPFPNTNFHLSLQSTTTKYLGAGWVHSKRISLLMVSSGLVFASCSKARLRGNAFFFQ